MLLVAVVGIALLEQGTCLVVASAPAPKQAVAPAPSSRSAIGTTPTPTPMAAATATPTLSSAPTPSAVPTPEFPPVSTLAPPPPAPPPVAAVAENLMFSGALSGSMQQAVNPHSDAYADPGSSSGDHAPTWTRCAFYKDTADTFWEADIVGDVSGSQVAVVIVINTSYTPLPGVDQSDVVLNVYGPGAHWGGVKATSDSRVTVGPDLHSGQISAGIPDRPYGNPVLTVSGDWHCR